MTLTIRQAAERLGMSKVWVWLHKDELGAFRYTENGKWLLKESVVQNFIKSRIEKGVEQ